ncbi:hypothetical protein D3C71_2160620 [compost metagenome]
MLMHVLTNEIVHHFSGHRLLLNLDEHARGDAGCHTLDALMRMIRANTRADELV